MFWKFLKLCLLKTNLSIHSVSWIVAIWVTYLLSATRKVSSLEWDLCLMCLCVLQSTEPGSYRCSVTTLITPLCDWWLNFLSCGLHCDLGRGGQGWIMNEWMNERTPFIFIKHNLPTGFTISLRSFILTTTNQSSLQVVTVLALPLSLDFCLLLIANELVKSCCFYYNLAQTFSILPATTLVQAHHLLQRLLWTIS